MKLIFTIDIPDDLLVAKLKSDRVTLAQFKEELGKVMEEDLLDAGELCPGATAKIEFRD